MVESEIKYAVHNGPLAITVAPDMRILITTVTAGAGHLQAASALEEVWREMRPDDVVEKVDLLDLVPRLQRNVYVKGYTQLVEHASGLWGMVFKKTDNPALLRKLTRLRRTLARRTNRRFIGHLKTFKPDAVLCTHYLPLEIMGHLKSKGARLLTACVVTDFEAHALWLEESTDIYCVAAAETKASLESRGIEPCRIVVTGIPIAPRFAHPPEPRIVRKAMGLRDDLPTLLVLGGGFGMGPVTGILDALEKTARVLQILVVTGRNEKLRRNLSGRDFRHPTRVMGFVTNMHELMAVSDVIVTKPGGLTSSESLALGKPMLILDPIPGQEAANSDFLLERGAAMKVNRVEDLPFRLDQLLGSRKLKEMARAARRLGHPDAAKRVCREVLGRLMANP
jgi:processive 1,2-diacylglycerol beta-glucosyltransferase